LSKIQERDEIKNAFCRDSNIVLHRIRFDEPLFKTLAKKLNIALLAPPESLITEFSRHKISTEKVRELRMSYIENDAPLEVLAASFGIHKYTVNLILRYRKYERQDLDLKSRVVNKIYERKFWKERRLKIDLDNSTDDSYDGDTPSAYDFGADF
jgi:hypothetical protein